MLCRVIYLCRYVDAQTMYDILAQVNRQCANDDRRNNNYNNRLTYRLAGSNNGNIILL